MATHKCPAPGCTRQVANDLLACTDHWYAIPKRLRLAVAAVRAAVASLQPRHPRHPAATP